MNYDLLIKSRKALQPLWEQASLKGRCWGPKREDNPYTATNITFGIGNELVSISQGGNKLVIHEFRKRRNTKLGEMVRKILLEKGLISEEKEVILMAADYIWSCRKCKKRGEFDATGITDPISIVNHICDDHQKATPGCSATNLQILDHEMRIQEKLMELLGLKRVKS